MKICSLYSLTQLSLVSALEPRRRPSPFEINPDDDLICKQKRQSQKKDECRSSSMHYTSLLSEDDDQTNEIKGNSIHSDITGQRTNLLDEKNVYQKKVIDQFVEIDIFNENGFKNPNRDFIDNMKLHEAVEIEEFNEEEVINYLNEINISYEVEAFNEEIYRFDTFKDDMINEVEAFNEEFDDFYNFEDVEINELEAFSEELDDFKDVELYEEPFIEEKSKDIVTDGDVDFNISKDDSFDIVDCIFLNEFNLKYTKGSFMDNQIPVITGKTINEKGNMTLVYKSGCPDEQNKYVKILCLCKNNEYVAIDNFFLCKDPNVNSKNRQYNLKNKQYLEAYIYNQELPELFQKRYKILKIDTINMESIIFPQNIRNFLTSGALNYTIEFLYFSECSLWSEDSSECSNLEEEQPDKTTVCDLDEINTMMDSNELESLNEIESKQKANEKNGSSDEHEENSNLSQYLHFVVTIFLIIAMGIILAKIFINEG